MKKRLVMLLAILLVAALTLASCGSDTELVEYLQSQLDELEEQLDEMSDKVSKLESENDKLKEENSKKNQELTELRTELSTLENEISRLESIDAENQVKIAELKAAYNEKVAALESEKQANVAALAALEAEHKAAIEGLEGNIAELEAAYNEKVSELEANKTANEEALAKLNAEHKAEVENLEGDISELEAAYNEKVSELEAEKQANAAALAALEAAHKAAIEGLEGNIAELEAAYNEKVAALEAEKQANAAALAALEAEHKAAVEAIEVENANLALQIAELEARIEELLNDKDYLVTFDVNGGAGAIEDRNIRYNMTVKEPTAPTKAHYDFLGWYVNGVKAEFPYVVTTHTDFVAEYAPTKYTITYVVNEGIMPSTYTTEYDVETSVTLPTPTHDSYYFAGWYEDADFSGEKVTEIAAGEFGNRTFYARWIAVTSGIEYELSESGEYYVIFDYKGNDTIVVIPDNIDGIPVAIGSGAFDGCSDIAEFIIPDSVVSISSDAFSGTAYYNDESNWVDGVLYIGNHLIKAKDTISGEYVIKDGTVTIADEAFYRCKNLTSITIPDSVTYIGSSAFAYCSSLTSITIPDSVTFIDYNAFYGTVYYEDESNWVNGVLYIGNHLINTKDSISGEFVIKDGTVTIADHAFSYCDDLTSITIPDSVKNIGKFAFIVCYNLANIIVDENNPNYESIDGNLYTKDGTTLIQYAIGKADTTFEIPNGVTNIGFGAFAFSHNLTEVVIPDSVTIIGEYAFTECSNLESVVIGESVKSIGGYAFSNCYSLTSVVIPNSVTEIGEEAFADCCSLKSVVIGDGVESIGEYAFAYCSRLEEIVIPDSVTEIGERAFCECYSLTNIIVDENNQYYQSIEGNLYTKDGATLVQYAVGKEDTTFEIPNGVTNIADGAFVYCSNLTSVVIPDSVTSIDDWAFYYCSSLESVVIGDSVTYIDSYAFYRCSSLTSITIPDSVEFIGDYAFSDCSSLTSVYITDLSNWCNISFGYYSNPLYYAGNLYLNGELVTELVIPDDVTVINDYAFSGCSSLTSITIPNSITSIGYSVFDGCDSLTDVYITDLTKWCNIEFGNASANPLYYAKNLHLNNELVTDLVIPDSVEFIGNYAFYSYDNLVSVTIGDSVTSIGDCAFSSCDSLTSVTIGDSVEFIGGSAFAYCDSLASVTIGDSVTSIGYMAFYNCDSLTDVYISDVEAWLNIEFGSYGSHPNSYGTLHILDDNGNEVTDIVIPDGVTNIPDYAFRNAKNITSVTIPYSVTTIDDYAFYNCSSLADVYISDVEAWLNIEFDSHPNSYGTLHILDDNGNEVTDLVIPDGVTNIPYYAFYNAKNITSVTIPDSVTSIGNYAFYNCSSLKDVYISDVEAWLNIEFDSHPNSYGTLHILDDNGNEVTDLVIPDGVTTIPDYAFENAKNITSITMPDSVTFIGYDAFYNTAYYKDESNWVDGVLYIGNHLIKANGTISGEYVIKDGTVTIVDYAFRYCSSLTSITIPDGVTSIGNYAFYNCSNLASITIPDSLTSIGSNVFYGTAYYNNESNWVDGVLYIGNHLIKANGTISGEYVIKDGTVTIADNAFVACSSLVSVTIPNSVTSIGNSAFYYCSSLESVVIGDSVTSIGSSAFEHCSSLESVVIGDSVTSIGDYAFYGCSSLTSVVIGDSVTSIGNNAFYGCSSLTEVYYNGTAAEWNSMYIGDANGPLKYATRYYYSETEPTTSGRYWYWVDGKAVIW